MPESITVEGSNVIRTTIILGGGHMPPRASVDLKKRNWRYPISTFTPSCIRTHNEGRYSSRCRYTRWTYTPEIESWGTITTPSSLYVSIDTHDGLFQEDVQAPRGWHWALDADGIALVSNTDARVNYHPVSTDFLVDRPSFAMARTARENAKKRRALARVARKDQADARAFARLVRDAERQGCRVCPKDSMVAGNCHAGTMAWADRHSIHADHAMPTAVLSADPGNDRVKIALLMAIRRHHREMAQGFSVLADHTA